MSGKFMSVKRIVVPMITMVIIASQLMGCAAMTSNQLLDAINNGDQIEIEIAVPLNKEQGTEVSVDWTQLDQLKSQPELRKSMDDTFKIIPVGDSKNGVFYVDLEGKQEGNNTLYNVFCNSIFRSNYWGNEDVQEEVAKAVAEVYADVEFEDGHYDRAMLAAINAYFNILNDSEPGYANMDSTISRIEAMAAIFKAEYPVSEDLTEDTDFNAAIGVDSSNEFAIFASNLSEQSYLDINSGSLDKLTAKGTITRGELAYMLVQKYFADEYNAVDSKTTCFSDVKNGGDIARAEKFIEGDNEKEGWQAYELTYALQNVDKGCPERMYKALVVAFEKGIITDSECRWDEGVTKADFLEMLTNTYSALPVAVSAERGTVDEFEAPVEETETDVDKSELNDIGNESYNGEDEIVPEEPVVETPSDDEGTAYTLTEGDKEALRALGATEDEINAVKTQEQFDALLAILFNRSVGNPGGSSGGSGGSGGNSGGDSGSSGGSGSDVDEDAGGLQPAPLGDPEDTLPGSM